MKKIFKFLLLIFCFSLLCSCGKTEDNSEELKKYKSDMTAFFTELEKIDTKINEISPEDQDSIEALFEQFNALEDSFKKLADFEVPKEFENNEVLADQAYDYMVQANEYLHQSFTETSYNQNVLDAAMECYRRANKRVQFIISILHGELPQDESVSYQ